MEVYAENQTLLKTSFLPEPIALDDEGSIQLATTLDDPTLKNITEPMTKNKSSIRSN